MGSSKGGKIQGNDSGGYQPEKTQLDPANPPKGNSSYDYVVKPTHYNRGKVETIDLIENAPLNLGTAMKYLDRLDGKPGQAIMQDAEKARWYILREFMRMGWITSEQWHQAVGREVPKDDEDIFS